ncbi:uncharacterized protein N7498_006910 [Penicillium cinerascens]|uniref:Mis12-Mtw1 family protein n=1 Tax=Penicillium cinerascens TaxID=70096 RepID=A0A9W9JJ15_9EURO|nr:uncharacterized protein N7498_006910 [Penicillium cinerascens]KAJ5197793.1 hypothetical protein N7498_006910 [Penicillium cinerascens]
MTIVVLAPPSTKTKRREPLGSIAMAAFQAQSRSAPASNGAGRGERRTTRNSASKQGLEEIINDGKRKAGECYNTDSGNYEEDADGFQFSIVPSKKPRPSLEAVPEVSHSDVENAPPKSTPRRGRPPKKRAEEKARAGPVPVKGQTTELPTRRPTRGTAKGADTEHEPQLESATRSSGTREPLEYQPEEKKRKRGRPGKPKPTEQNGFKSPDQPPAGTKIALPIADTPVIQRNKELRGGKSDKGQRRSSLGLRGRRASSLIDSGASNALPHREVSTADFYKHIADDGLPEPRRMRQLLIWCATRALGDKRLGSHSDDQSARLAARAIQEDLVKEFSSNSGLSNWFSREDVNPPTVVVKKPNPRNVQNTDKIKDLEEQIQKLQKERHALNALSKQPPIPRISERGTGPSDQAKAERYPKKPSPKQIDSALLDPSQQSILASLDPSAKVQPQPEEPSSSSTTQPPMSPSTVSSRLSRITTVLAPTLDSFAAGIHDIEMYRTTADAVSSRILRTCARRLEERDAFNTQQRLAIEGDDDEERPPSQRAERPREDIGIILGALSRVERR